MRFCQKITKRRAERSGQNKGEPKQEHTGHFRVIGGENDQRKQTTDQHGPSCEAQAGIVGKKITQRSPQCIREQNRRPIEDFHLA